MGHIWFDGDVPLFHVNFHTRMALMKLVAGKSEVEKKLMTKLRSKLLLIMQIEQPGTEPK